MRARLFCIFAVLEKLEAMKKRLVIKEVRTVYMDGTSATVYEVAVRIVWNLAVPLRVNVFGPDTLAPYCPSWFRSDDRKVCFASCKEAEDFIRDYKPFERCNGYRIVPAFYVGGGLAAMHWVAFSGAFRLDCIHEEDKKVLYRRIEARSVSHKKVRIIETA